jgi:L-ascorbate metabolism protein UlaG (beta-lactamase superfamily)
MLKITWLGHASFELQFPTGEILLLDPWLETNPSYPKQHKITRVDAIAVTHGHMDHTADVIPLATQFYPKVLAIFEIATFFAGKGVKNPIGMNKGGTVDLGFVKLTMVHALHSSSIQDGTQTFYAGEAAAFILTLPDNRRAYFAGDTMIFSDMKLYAEIFKPTLAFLPIGDNYTMRPDEASYAAKMLNVKEIIPMHWGTFPQLTGTPEVLEKKLAGTGIKVHKLKPGESTNW